MPIHQHEDWQIRESDPGSFHCAACGAPIQNREPAMTAENDTPALPNPHRLEIELSGRGINARIDYKAVCDAPVGAPCRMWCKHPDCQEDTVSDDHADHALVDQGQCNLAESLNVDPGMIPEVYEGETTQLRPGPITITPDCDGVTWTYSGPAPALTVDERAELEEYRRRDAAGYVEYAVESDQPFAYKTTNLVFSDAAQIRRTVELRGATARIMQRAHSAPSAWVPIVRPACESGCRHRCPSCRNGLVTHLTCDPQCDLHLPAADA